VRKVLLSIALGLLACTGEVTGPTGLYPGYSLVSFDGQFLPASDGDTPEGAVIIAANLDFPREDRSRGGRSQYVSHTRWFRFADGTVERLTLELEFEVADGEVRINLCPPLALCIVTTELIGRVDDRDLVLTHVLAGQPRGIYRYMAALPE